MTEDPDAFGKRIDVAMDRLQEALHHIESLCDERPVAGPARLEEASKRLPPDALKLMYAMVKANADSVFDWPPRGGKNSA